MARHATKGRIVWALDPYGSSSVQRPAAKLAGILSQTMNLELVYVHGRGGFPMEPDRAAIRAGLAHAEKELEKTLKDLRFKAQRPPRILAHGSEYVRADVKMLSRFARRLKADAILVGTQARTGLARHALGSFAETLLLESSVPTLIVSAKAQVRPRPGAILFPTDFGAASWKGFKKVVSFAKSVGASIDLFHQYQGIPQTIPKEVLFFKGNHWLEGENLLEANLRRARMKSARWVKWSRARGVVCRPMLEFGWKNISDATLALAKKRNSWMIAMVSVTGPVASAFLGSNARWIVRRSTCPVWVQYVSEQRSRS